MYIGIYSISILGGDAIGSRCVKSKTREINQPGLQVKISFAHEQALSAPSYSKQVKPQGTKTRVVPSELASV